MKRKDSEKKRIERNLKIITRYKELVNIMGYKKSAAVQRISEQKEYGMLSSRQIQNILKEEGL